MRSPGRAKLYRWDYVRVRQGACVVHPASTGPAGGGLSEDPNLTIAEAPTAPALRELLSAWQSWPKAGRLPRRDAFDPVGFPRHLSWLLLFEHTDHANRYRDYDLLYRYVGSAFAETLQSEGLTGTYLSALPDPFPERWFPTFDRLRESAKPFAVHGKPYLVDKTYLRFELLYLPLARNEPAEADAVGYCLIGMHREAVR
jgi:hypothetical protein